MCLWWISLWHCLISLFAALATGGAVIAGQYMGKKQMEESREAANQLVWFVWYHFRHNNGYYLSDETTYFKWFVWCRLRMKYVVMQILT